VKIHVQTAIEKAVQNLLTFYHERQEALHGALWGEWMAGKTKSALRVASRNPKVKYMKFPERRITETQFVSQIVLSLKVGPKRSFVENLDLIKEWITHRNETYVLIIDEAQRLFEKPKFLSILKDIVEEIEVYYPAGLLLLFLGDRKLSRFLTNEYHSLVKRIIIRKALSPIAKETVVSLLAKHSFEPDAADEITALLKSEGVTTGELDVALHLARKKGLKEITPQSLEKFLKAAVGGIR